MSVTDGDAAHFAESYRGFRDAGDTAEPAVGASDHDMLYIMYTSGTTGLPKELCILPIDLGIAHNWRYSGVPRPRALSRRLPMFHVGALTPLAVNVYMGATSVVMRSFDPVAASGHRAGKNHQRAGGAGHVELHAASAGLRSF